MMARQSDWNPHRRPPGYLAAWRTLNARVAADLAAGRGHITAPRRLPALATIAKLFHRLRVAK